MRRTTLSVLSSLAILLSGMIVPEAAAQSRRDKEQTYVLEKPYEVHHKTLHCECKQNAEHIF